jgi:dihydrofolate synthase/folylpolyglutamate synthase
MQNLSDGRLKKKLGKRFDIWLDGGHNEDAANMISSFIKDWRNQDKIMILAMTSGKNPTTFLKKIINQFKLVILLPIENHQYIQPYEIKQSIRTKFDHRIKVECRLNINEAIDLILERYSSGKILICGSLYLAGQILKKDGFKIK